jgi:tight adherence protein B
LLARRHRRRGVRRRVVEFTAGATTDIAAVAHTPTNSLPALERWLGRAGWWRSFKTEVEIAHVQRTPAELVVMTAISTAAVALLLGVSSGSPVPSILALPLGPLVLRSMVKWRLRRQRELFGEQLPTHLQELASTMRAGHSLISGIAMIAEAAPEPSASEWARVVADEQLGLPLEEAMRPLAERMANDDVEQVALVAILHQRTGGNMADVLERVAEAIRERAELRRELRALTAQARLSRYLLTALPLVVLAAVTLINPQYVEPLFDTTTGVILLLVGAGLLLGASRIMRAITDIKV